MPTLGQSVRALRLGYWWSERNQGFIRISGGKEGQPFRCELMPVSLISNSHKSEIPHWHFWQGGDAQTVIDSIAYLRGITKVERESCFYFNDNGETV